MPDITTYSDTNQDAFERENTTDLFRAMGGETGAIERVISRVMENDASVEPAVSIRASHLKSATYSPWLSALPYETTEPARTAATATVMATSWWLPLARKSVLSGTWTLSCTNELGEVVTVSGTFTGTTSIDRILTVLASSATATYDANGDWGVASQLFITWRTPTDWDLAVGSDHFWSIDYRCTWESVDQPEEDIFSGLGFFNIEAAAENLPVVDGSGNLQSIDAINPLTGLKIMTFSQATTTARPAYDGQTMAGRQCIGTWDGTDDELFNAGLGSVVDTDQERVLYAMMDVTAIDGQRTLFDSSVPRRLYNICQTGQAQYYDGTGYKNLGAPVAQRQLMTFVIRTANAYFYRNGTLIGSSAIASPGALNGQYSIGGNVAGSTWAMKGKLAQLAMTRVGAGGHGGAEQVRTEKALTAKWGYLNIVCIGNSLTYGIGTTSPSPVANTIDPVDNSYPGQLKTLITTDGRVVKLGFPGSTTPTIFAAPSIAGYVAYKVPGAVNVAVMWEAVNHMGGGATAQQAIDAMDAAITLMRDGGWDGYILVPTCTPYSGGTISGKIPAYNALLRTKVWTRPGDYGVVDVGPDPQLIYPGTDGTHFNNAQAGVVAQTVYDAINARFPR